MPTTTRSKTQIKAEDKGVLSSKPVPETSSASETSSVKKRNAPASQQPPSKKQKTQPDQTPTTKGNNAPKNESTADDNRGERITINRAPVLELWAGCVAQFTHPKLTWTTALSIGGAISTITAISKGRSIGKIDKPDPAKAREKREKRAEAEDGLAEVEVMGFNLKIKDGSAMVGGKAKKGNEEALRKKFGGEEFERARQVMQDALESWRGKEEDLDGKAFRMYEEFRPSVAAGQKGWGRKGELNLDTVRSAAVGG